MQKDLNKKLVKNAVIISAGGFISKLLGAFYRIPLTNMLGSVGLGLYQMVFPVYCILLDFAGAGLPCGLSKLISSNVGEDAEEKNLKLLKTAIKFMSIIGILGSFLMALFAKPISTLQGNSSAYLPYVALAPAVFFVAIISCYRGYFQGKQNMLPTALSQIVEQVIKLAFGLILVGLFSGSAVKGATGATFAVSLSEAVALIVIVFLFKKQKSKSTTVCKGEILSYGKSIFKICLPVTLTSVLLPFSHTVDSFLIINMLGKYTQNATSLYGLLSGGVMSVIGLPVSLCYGLAVSALPMISKSSAENDGEESISSAIGLTALFAGIMALFCYFFNGLIIKILFFGLGVEEKIITAKLLKITSVSIFFLSLLQTTNSVLVGKNKPYIPVISLSIGIAIKILFEVLLLPNPNYNIYGAGFSSNLCYFVAVFINLLYIIKVCGKFTVKNTVKRSNYDA